MTIAERIKTARKAAGLTQNELGERMSVSGAAIGQYESGKRVPKVDTLQRIANALDIPITDLVNSPLLQKIDSYNPDTDQKKQIKDMIKEVAVTIQEKRDAIYRRTIKTKLNEDLDKLNDTGLTEAGKRVEELTQIEKYQMG